MKKTSIMYKYLIMKNRAILLVSIVYFSITTGYTQTDTTHKKIISKSPSCDCDSLWKKKDVSDCLQILGNKESLQKFYAFYVDQQESLDRLPVPPEWW